MKEIQPQRWWEREGADSLRKYQPMRFADIAGHMRLSTTYVDKFSAAMTFAELESIASDFCRDNGLKSGGSMLLENNDGKIIPHKIMTYEIKEFTQSYINENYIDIDHVSYLSRHNTMPICWGMDQHKKNAQKNEKKLYSFLGDYGSYRGIVVPQHGPRGFMILGMTAADKSDAELQARLPVLAGRALMFGAALYDATLRIIGTPAVSGPPPKPLLTPRETECLHWAAAGKTAWEISCILGVSERTVVAHTENAKKKLDAKTLPQAVARAIGAGLIAP